MVRKYANSNSNVNRTQFRDDRFFVDKKRSIKIYTSNSNLGIDRENLFLKEIEEWDLFEAEFKARHGFDFPF